MSRRYSPVATPRVGKLRRGLKYFGGGLAVIGICWGIRQIRGPDSASAKTPPAAPAANSGGDNSVVRPSSTTAPTTSASQQVVAVVNGEPIQRQELASECIRHYGKEVLEGMVNKRLISDYCTQRNIVITKKEVDDEIDRMARKFGLPTDQWLKMLKQERGIKASQYAQDIVWPTLALRKLAASRLVVSPQELNEAFETEFGSAVRVRLIVVEKEASARQIAAAAKGNPDEFPSLARKFSVDTSSASNGGLIQPIRMHVGDKQLERAAFELDEKNPVSAVIPVANQFAILKFEGRVPERTGVDKSKITDQLSDAIRDRKLRTAAAEVFQQLQKDAKVENVLNDPAKRQLMPGVAATINGQPITMRELGEECIERWGSDVLDGTINRRLLEQSLKKRNMTVTQDDINAEIGRAAASMGKTDAAGHPDVEAWLKTVTKEQNVTVELYIHDAVWPSVALKKVVGEVPVTADDMNKGFDANYGPRVRCRAIVMSNQRKAQEVWELARGNPTIENFGKLAEQYSVEAGSKALQGKVPPIAKNTGSPVMEEEAFKLKKGELSSIIQVGDKFVILMCEGYTDPVKVKPEEVHDDLFADIHEKKQRIQMAKAFESLKDDASIDNFLAGTTQTPKKALAKLGPKAGSLDNTNLGSVRQTSGEQAAPRAGSNGGANNRGVSGGADPATSNDGTALRFAAPTGRN